VPLSVEVSGYAFGPFPYPPCDTCLVDPGSAVVENKVLGSRWQNTILMGPGPIRHSGPNQYAFDMDDATPAFPARADITATHAYMRGDASGQYSRPHWTTIGYSSNAAQTFVRDFFWHKAGEWTAFFDRVGYSGAATESPTMWIARFTGDPTISGQRMTSIKGGQKIVHDIVYPTAMRLNEIDEDAVHKDINNWRPIGYYRVESVSGETATTEYSLQIQQMMDEGDSPLSVTALTNTNARVAQIGSAYVVGVATGTSPTLPITYDVSGTPEQWICGMAVSTNYKVTRTTDTIAIATDDGTNIQTSNSAGCLRFTL
jgi:hypothetical protein